MLLLIQVDRVTQNLLQHPVRGSFLLDFYLIFF